MTITTLSEKAVQDSTDEEAKAAAEAAFKAALESTQCLFDSVGVYWYTFTRSNQTVMRRYTPPEHVTHVVAKGKVFEIGPKFKLWFDTDSRYFTVSGLRDENGLDHQVRFDRSKASTLDAITVVSLRQLRSNTLAGAGRGTNPSSGMGYT